MLLNKNNLNMVNFTSTDGGRYAINGVCIRKDGRTVATDGKRLMTCSPCTEKEEEFPDFNRDGSDDGWYAVLPEKDIVIEREHIIAARKALPKKKKTLPFLREHVQMKSNGNGRLQFVATDLANTSRIETHPIEGTFPDFNEVIPGGQAEFTISVNPSLLAEMLDTMAESMDSPRVKMEFYGSSMGMKISCETDKGQEMIGVLMPVVTKK